MKCTLSGTPIPLGLRRCRESALGLAVKSQTRGDAQQAMRDHLVDCGFDYLCTESVEVAIGWLQARGILRGGMVLIG